LQKVTEDEEHTGSTKHDLAQDKKKTRAKDETQVETMRAGLAIKQEAKEWLRAGGENEPIRDRADNHREDTGDKDFKIKQETRHKKQVIIILHDVYITIFPFPSQDVRFKICSAGL